MRKYLSILILLISGYLYSEDNYTPFSTNQNTIYDVNTNNNSNSDYNELNSTFNSTNYENDYNYYNNSEDNFFEYTILSKNNGDNNNIHKCEYCGKPDYHANCHAHKKWCPYYCGDDDENPLPLGDDVLILGSILLIYIIFKKLWNLQ